MFFYGFDPTFVLLIPAIIFALYAQFKVKATFATYSEIYSAARISAAQVARAILDRHGLYDVRIEPTPGELTDHYDPRVKTLRLSQPVYNSSSLAAIGVAAHEAGHAVQHAKNYGPLTLRNAIVPVAQLGSWAAWPLLLLGFMFQSFSLVELGILVFIGVVLFQIVTLPVEFDASKRAIAVLANEGFLQTNELKGAKKVLDAAALTYVAAALMGIMQLIRLLIISGILGRRDD